MPTTSILLNSYCRVLGIGQARRAAHFESRGWGCSERGSVSADRLYMSGQTEGQAQKKKRRIKRSGKECRRRKRKKGTTWIDKVFMRKATSCEEPLYCLHCDSHDSMARIWTRFPAKRPDPSAKRTSRTTALLFRLCQHLQDLAVALLSSANEEPDRVKPRFSTRVVASARDVLTRNEASTRQSRYLAR